mgnify:CR=1 FL=1
MAELDIERIAKLEAQMEDLKEDTQAPYSHAVRDLRQAQILSVSCQFDAGFDFELVRFGGRPERFGVQIGIIVAVLERRLGHLPRHRLRQP